MAVIIYSTVKEVYSNLAFIIVECVIKGISTLFIPIMTGIIETFNPVHGFIILSVV